MSRVATFGFLALVFLVAVVGLAETLRHPVPEGRPAAARGDDGDPRIPVDCPGVEPREGSVRPAEPREGRIGTEVPPGTDVVDVTSDDLLDCPSTFAGRPVRYTGEVVGGVLQRRDGAWVQLNDDVYASGLGPLPGHRDFQGANSGIGVHLPRAAVTEITWVGGPRSRGDVLEVVGRFHRVDPRSHEVAVIRADEVRLVRVGAPFEHPQLRDRQLAAAITGLIAVLFLIAQVLRSRRFRRVAGLDPL